MSGTEKEKKISFTLQRTRNKAYFFIHPSVTSVLSFYCSSYFPLRSSFCSHSFQFPSCSCVVAEHAKPRIKLKLYGHDMVEGCILDSLTTFQYTDRRGEREAGGGSDACYYAIVASGSSFLVLRV